MWPQILEKEMEFREGDTVYLKSGGPAMKIKRLYNTIAICEWGIDQGVKQRDFALLALIKEEPKHPTASAEMPLYDCHKQVHALQIKQIEFNRETGGAILHPFEDGYAPFEVDADYIDKHKPMPGGYYVVYKDGYKSFSPAKAFEEGYTRHA